MNWTDSYWNIIKELYEKTKYLGFASINDKVIKELNIPVDEINNQYSSKDNKLNIKRLWFRNNIGRNDIEAHARKQEEILNFVYDLTFSILDSEISKEILSEFIEYSDTSELSFTGCKTPERYGKTYNDNITVPDGYFVSDDYVIAMEHKFKSPTSINQLAKYIYLFNEERKLTKKDKNYKLIYILDEAPVEKLKNQLSTDISTISELDTSIFIRSFDNKTNQVCKFISNNPKEFRNILSKVKIVGYTWTDFTNVLDIIIDKQPSDIGGRMVRNLLGGLSEEIKKHPYSKYKPKV